jgi:hypothetical protein
MKMKFTGIYNLLCLDIQLGMGVTKYWHRRMPVRRLPVLILLFAGTMIAALINCYLMAWGIVKSTNGMPSFIIRPMFLYFRGELKWQSIFWQLFYL